MVIPSPKWNFVSTGNLTYAILKVILRRITFKPRCQESVNVQGSHIIITFQVIENVLKYEKKTSVLKFLCVR